MPHYSEEFKEKLVREMMSPGGRSVSEIQVLPVLAYLVDSAVRSFAPKGLRISAQGCCAAATLGRTGSARATQPTLKGLRHCFPRPPLRNPVGVGSLCVPFPG